MGRLRILNAGLLAACLLCGEAGIFLASAAVRKADLDGDGYEEAEVYSEGERIVLVTLDKNNDGKPDGTIHYRDGFRDSAEIDSDFDGTPDTFIQYYFTGVPAVVKVDRNGDGLPDTTHYFKNGFEYKKERDRNGDGVPDFRVIYETGADLRPVRGRTEQAVIKQYDEDYDGVYERLVTVHRWVPIKKVSLVAGASETEPLRS
jgi:hypothetical protein